MNTGGGAAAGAGNAAAAGSGSGFAGAGGAESGSGGNSGTAGLGGDAGASGAPMGSTLVVSSPGDYWKTLAPPVEIMTGDASVTVDDTASAQVFEGFGGIFHEMGWYYLSELSETDRNRALELLFGEDGCRLALGRIPIGASDFALERYTENETAGDYAMENFSIERDRLYLVPYIQAALTVRPDLRLWASPWTPPTWMKVSTSGSGPASFDRGQMKSDSQTLLAYAVYLAKFVQAYEALGIDIEAVAPQTDPLIEDDIPSCSWTAEAFATFIGRYLGPIFVSEGISADISVSAIGLRDSGTRFINTVLADAGASSYSASVGLVWDMMSQLEVLGAVNLPLWHTQHFPGNPPFDVSSSHELAPNDHAYGVESWTHLRQWIQGGAVSYTAGNLVLDEVGWGNRRETVWAQNALLVVEDGALRITPAYYVFRHLSAFVEPGARVIGVTGADALAFKNPDGRVVVVIYNAEEASQAIVSVSGRKVAIDLPENGWATLTTSFR
jgi:glucosylceramidase